MTQTSTFSEAVRTIWRGLGPDESPLLADVPGVSWSLIWRSVVGVIVGAVGAAVALIVVMVIAGVIWMVMAGPVKVQEQMPQLQALMGGETELNFASALWVIVALFTLNGAAAVIIVALASLICRTPIKHSFTTAPRWRWGQLAVGLGLGVVTLGPIMALDVMRGGTEAKLPLLTFTHSPLEVGVYFAVSLVGLTLAAGAEEILFRGWLMRQSAGILRLVWIFLPLNAVLFSAAHGDFDPNSFIDRALAGISLGYMALRLGGTEYSTGAHTANNLLIVLFIAPISLKPPEPTPFDYMVLVEGLAALTLAIGGVELALRWAPLKALMGPTWTPNREADAF